MTRVPACGKGLSLSQISSKRYSLVVFARPPFELSLECSTVPQKDDKLCGRLRAHDAFTYNIHPDLSAPSSWKALFSWNSKVNSSPLKPLTRSTVKNVETLPVNLRAQHQLERLVLEVYNTKHPKALLCVSGNHPVRRLPFINRWLPTSVNLLEVASTLQARGDVHPSLQLWGVGNPVTEKHAERLERKAEAGAEAFLTQPPLHWGNFEQWMNDVRYRGLHDRCRISIGIPMLTSAAHLRFWISLCGGQSQGELQLLLNQWTCAENEMSKDDFKVFRLDWNRSFIKQIKTLPGVRGLHVMPFSNVGREMVFQLLDDGTL